MFARDSRALDLLDAAHREQTELDDHGYAKDAVDRQQQLKLDALWDRAVQVPYYRELPAVAARSLERLPVTPKSALKADPWAFVRSDAEVASFHKYYESSGSTGSPTPTPRLVEDAVWNTASVASLWRRTLRPGDRVASLLPSDVAPVGDLVASVAEYLDCTLLRSYPFSQGMCDWDRLEELFTRYRPQHVFAAPGVIIQWTRILKQRRRLEAVRESVESLMLLGEVSTPALRSRLALEWDARALDASYGSTETGTIAASCEHDRLHVLLPGQFVELWDGERATPLEPGRSGELVTTTLNNFARPLLRYGTGDLVTADVGTDCRCGVALPTLTVHGRESDGISVHGVPVSVAEVESVVYQEPGVTGYLIQLVRPEGHRARLVLERDVDFDGDEQALCDDVRERFAGHGLLWDQVVLVGQLPTLTKAGGSQKNWKRTNVQWVEPS
ncbi:phenylacetate--CoA ligase family protein [Streptacidiphilus melanogenes]|uniref:phenylacetate--CoA ligase family protein n=1 Tax=Streptacidiphilus melanogenes TaxID=411235 RepID=UPI0007C67F16|nr:AMP-binding protein [Streptacidiphilus melanogenes]